MTRLWHSAMGFLLVTLAANFEMVYTDPQLYENFRLSDSYSRRVSGCESYWSLINYNSEIFGKITIPNPSSGRSEIRAVLSVAVQLTTRYVGEITLMKDTQSAVRDIANGLPLVYRVRFPVQNPLPRPTAIYYNDQQICQGDKDSSQYFTTITLYHTLYETTRGINSIPQSQTPRLVLNTRPPPFYGTQTPAYQPPVYATQPPTYPPPVYTTQPPTYAPAIYTTQPPTYPPPVYTNPPPNPQPSFRATFDESLECGMPSYTPPRYSGLIFQGKVAVKGQFPWLAAYYYNGEESSFICGGSLVSTKIVITAAHCVHNKEDALIRKAEESLFFIGKHNIASLQNDEGNFYVSGAIQFIVHPDWDFRVERFDADIAIVVLLKTVTFSNFVKPICLWTSTNSYEDLVGRQGVVAGWGKTEHRARSTDEPRWAELSVVSEVTCLRSNPVYNELTSNRTFCAGDSSDKMGPCQGDSGGGFVVNDGGKWYLRGIVSSALLTPVQTCDTESFAVFTDVTKYTSWIQGYIGTYG